MDENELSSSSLESLPYEMVEKIFDRLSHGDRKSSRLVCKRLKTFLDGLSQHLVFSSTLTNASQRPFFNSTLQMNSTLMKKKTNRMPRNLTFPYIRHAVIGCKNSARNIVKFLKYGINHAESLVITNLSFEKMNIQHLLKCIQLKENSMKNLTQLKLGVTLIHHNFESAVNHLEVVMIFLKLVKIPALEDFDLDLHHGWDILPTHAERELRFQNFCLAFYKFLSTHARTLKILNSTIVTSRYPNWWFKIPNISQALRQSSLSLQSVKIRLWGVTQIEAIITPFLFGSQLQNFELNTRRPLRGIGSTSTGNNHHHIIGETGVAAIDSNVLDENLQQIIENNSKCLKTVKIYWFPPAVPVGSFKNCCLLESVYVKRLETNRIRPPSPPATMQIPPENIFDASTKSLRHINFRNFEMMDFSWFGNCLYLETLEIGTDYGISRNDMSDMYRQGLIPFQRLKKFHVILDEMENPLVVQEVQQLLSRCGEILEDLKINAWPRPWLSTNYKICLRECIALKKLEVEGSWKPECFMEGTIPMNFTNLTTFLTSFDKNARELIDWIIESMPNLQILGNVHYRAFDESEDEYFPFIEKLLRELPKLRKISFYANRWKRNEYPEVDEFVDKNPGIEIVADEDSEDTEEPWNKDVWFVIDRSIYIPPSQ